MQNLIFDVLDDDYNEFLENIYTTYKLSKKISLDSFKEKYMLNRLVFYNAEPEQRGKNTMTVPDDNTRCTARVWGGKESVYRKEDGIWNYGYRCKRKCLSGNDFCVLHCKNQPHGIYSLDPPHNHYDKYKIDC